MELSENRYITRYTLSILSKDEWTMEKLATTTPGILTEYRYIGESTAKKIIEEAQFLVNKAKLDEAVAIQTGEKPPPQQVSVRLQRLRDQNQE